MDNDGWPRTTPITRRSVLASAGAGAGLGVVGCLGDDSRESTGGGYGPEVPATTDTDEFVFTATVRETPADVERNYAPLADWITERTDVPTRIDPVQGNSAAITALATGQAHAAYLSGGPAWVGWQTYGLEPLAVEADEEGNTYYTAAAWVRADSGIETVADLEGVDSCHTGDLTGAGMLIPMAHLAHAGLVTFDKDDDITAIRDAVEAFFGDPMIGGGYVGALQCLSEGHGDVGFMRKSTPTDYCDGPDAQEWCLNMNEYELLEEFAEVPSHPIMASPTVTDSDFELLRAALLDLNDDPDGRAILADVLDTAQLVAASSAEHLGDYGELIEILPGIEDHLVE